MIDEAVDEQPEVYFEAGDHQHLVHMTQAEFFRLTSGAPRARFSRPD
jgi:Ala-tRNA(Pro) deacylase